MAGFLVAVLSVALDDRQLAGGAIALLTLSLILRIVSGKPEDRSQDGPGL